MRLCWTKDSSAVTAIVEGPDGVRLMPCVGRILCAELRVVCLTMGLLNLELLEGDG